MKRLSTVLKGGVSLVVGVMLMFGFLNAPVLAQEETPMQQGEQQVEITDGEILDLFIAVNEAEVQTSEVIAEGERVPTGGEQQPPEQQQEVPPREDTLAQQQGDTLQARQQGDTLQTQRETQEETQQTQGISQYFSKWDEDGDSRLSEEEFQSGFSESVFSERTQTENATRQFNQWDEDGDGYLSQSELQSGLSEISGVEQMGEQDTPSRAETGGDMPSTQQFSQWDEDGDGRLSEDEFESGFSESVFVKKQQDVFSEEEQTETARRKFEEWDEDGNSYLSEEEFRSGLSELSGSEQMGEQDTPPRGETGEHDPSRAEIGGDEPQNQQQTTGAGNNEVQQFAQRMIDEHSQVIDQAKQLGNRQGIQPEENLASQIMRNSVQGLVDKLSGSGDMATMGGDEPETPQQEPQQQQQQQQEMGQEGQAMGQMNETERQYMMAQVSLHQRALLLLDNTLIPNAENQELRQMLESERETIQQHLDKAKQIISNQFQQSSMGQQGQTGGMNN